MSEAVNFLVIDESSRIWFCARGRNCGHKSKLSAINCSVYYGVEARAELTELRAVLAAVGAKKESGGWTMLNPHRDWHAWTEEEGYTCDACGDGPHCDYGFQSHVPIPGVSPVAGKGESK